MDFINKVVVITGASQGFGKAFARALLKEKATVILSSNDAVNLRTTAEELSADYYAADVTQPMQLKKLADYVTLAHGKIDIWINNAGIQIAPSPVEAVDVQRLHDLFEINFFGYFYGCQAVLPILKKQRYGAIININSTAGLSGKPNLSAYVASKYAIKGLTESLRQEVRDSGISVYGIHPGGMQTAFYKEAYPSDFDSYMSVDYAIRKIIDNFKLQQPELDLIIRRP